MGRALILGAALLLSACASNPPPLAVAAKPCADPEMDARIAAEKADRARYEYARDHTEDGSRAYGFFLQASLVNRSMSLMLLVAPDGGGTLLGWIPKPVALTADEVRPVEDALRPAGFPHLFSAGPGDEIVCNDAPQFPPVFQVARDGLKAESSGNACGGMVAGVSQAAEALVKLARTHGGLADRPQPMICVDTTVPPRLEKRRF